MDKSWIELRDRNSKAYIDGVQAFINFAYKNKNVQTSHIKCPCSRCVNRFYNNLQTVKIHINMYGFEKSYKDWIYHGELYRSSNNNNDNLGDNMVVDDISIEPSLGAGMSAMVHEGRGILLMEDNMGNDEPRIEDDVGSNENLPKYFKLLQEAENELYQNCPKGITELSFVVELLHLKQLNGWTNHSFTMLLVLLKKVFPDARIPKSFYQANKLTTDLGFNYETWDACPNSCMLFRNKTENLDKCEICDTSRYKRDAIEVDHGEHGTKVAAKKVRYFPLKPRLQRLFWSSHTAPLMKWHVEERIDDGVMRHPADSPAWKMFDGKNPSFASDSRNVRLGLATDGFNPFGNMSVAHSTWPIVLMPYNLPPWLCMKQPHLILSILIDGPKGPGDKIDVFLQPLIDELKELWSEGLSTYDASSKQFFQLHAALLWTISDFPAYAMLSGWSTKGEFACPYCNKDHQATRLKHGGSNEGTSSRRRGRGSAKPWKGWGKGKKMIEWNEKCQPIGNDATQLATQLGYFARQGNLFPLDVPSWDKMEKHRLTTIWENVQDNTNAPDGYVDLCLKKIGLQWKRFKSDLKDKYYNKFLTDEERLAHAPPHVETAQWEYLVEFWGTEKSKKVASQNSQNRANLCCYPKTGKKSFPRVIEEMKAQGLLTDKISVWLYTRKKNESYSDTDGSADKEEMIQRKLEVLPEDQQTDEEVRNKIFEEVIGSDGHGNCLCTGVDIRPEPKRTRPSPSSSQQQEEITELRKEVEEREIRHKEEIAELRKEAEEREDKVRTETDEKINKTKEFFIILMRQAGIPVPDDILGSSIQL